jgi:hypothetical protein
MAILSHAGIGGTSLAVNSNFSSVGDGRGEGGPDGLWATAYWWYCSGCQARYIAAGPEGRNRRRQGQSLFLGAKTEARDEDMMRSRPTAAYFGLKIMRMAIAMAVVVTSQNISGASQNMW